MMRKRSTKQRKRMRRRLIQCEPLESRRLLAPVLVDEQDDNDYERVAQYLNLGTGTGKTPEITVVGSYDTAGTPDYFKFNLKAGDVFSARVNTGSGATPANLDISLGLMNASETSSTEMRGTNSLNAIGLPPLSPADSPVLTGGDLYFSYVAPVDGVYSFRLGTGISVVGLPLGSYTLDFQALRSPLESEPAGTHQILFLDFDGGYADLSEVYGSGTGITGTIRLPSMVQSLEDLGFEVTNEDRLIDQIIAEVENKFAYVGQTGNNGDFQSTGIPGQFDIEIRNSRDDPDPWGEDNVSRVFMTGSGGDIQLAGVFGIAQTIDYGNFDTTETAFVLAEEFFAGTVSGNVFGVPVSVSVPTIDAVAKAMGLVALHEAGHFFGLRHTNNANIRDQIMDTGGNLAGLMGVGNDGIFGTADDVEVNFGTDFFSPGEPDLNGMQNSVNTLAFGLASGSQGGSVGGRVFVDTNKNGVDNSEPGLAGVTVFADLNGNGILNDGEPRAVSNATGQYSFGAIAGSYKVVAITPSGYSPTTATSQTIVAGSTNATGPAFGFTKVDFDVTGVSYLDTNGNKVHDASEGGLAGVYIYIDLDGDSRIDVFEPSAITAADGSYHLDFPGPGTYTIREVVPPGYTVSEPNGGSYVVQYNGTSLDRNYDFGHIATRDFGDLPTGYPTLLSENGPSHGFRANYGLGVNIDLETDGIHSSTALGDDLRGPTLNASGTVVDDEDGVILTSTLAPSASATLQVTVRNDGTTGYLQGWIDLNGDNDFNDAGERLFTNLALGAGVHTLTTPVLPASTTPGVKNARFRYGPEANLTYTGFSTAGEVEDYQFTVQASTALVQDDYYDDLTNPSVDELTIPRDSVSNSLHVLANDAHFDSSLRIVAANSITGTTTGTLQVSADGQYIIYTPRPGFVGIDRFTYSVVTDSTPPGSIAGTATVVVNVIYETSAPEAVDDIFDVPENASSVTLPVLANDNASPFGGMQIISVGPTDHRGTVSIISGAQQLRYTPASGFRGTEQFEYTIRDASGLSSTATVTIEMQPGSQIDDEVAFTIELLDDSGQPLGTNPAINVGDYFRVRVMVNDISSFSGIRGVASAYVDMLYNDSYVSIVPPTDTSSNFPFDITFAPQFRNANTASALVPGLINEAGGSRDVLSEIVGATELFTMRMQAVGAGVSEFKTDPADNSFSDVVLVSDTDTEVPVSLQRFGTASLNISPAGVAIPRAVDDSFHVAGGSGENYFSVLANDIAGSAGANSLAVVSQPPNGFARIEGNQIVYTPQALFRGLDQFTYTILSPNGFRSTATVSVFVGSTAELNADDLVDLPFQVFDASGNAITDAAGNQIKPIRVGDTFTLQVNVDDLRPDVFQLQTGVFAAYLDILYDRNVVMVDAPGPNQQNNLNFNVQFGPFYTNSRVGDASLPGIINEVGAVQTTNNDGSGNPLGTQPRDLMEIKFTATAAGTFNLAGDPADISPFQDTLLYQTSTTNTGPMVVPLSRIRYDTLALTVSPSNSAVVSSEFQNPLNRFDVNNDGEVTPIDALSVLNSLTSTGGATSLQASGEQAASVTRFVDVNGDNKLSPVDALQVLNELARRISVGIVGEFAANSSNDSQDEAIVSIADDFSDASPATMAPSATASSSSQVLAANTDWLDTSAKEDDDDDDLLDQIASDVSGQWTLPTK